MRTETFKFFFLFYLFLFPVFAQTNPTTHAKQFQARPAGTVKTATPQDLQRFTFKTESKSFEKTKFKKLGDARKAVEKYRKSFAGRIPLLEKRCIDRFGAGYKYNGVSLKERAIGYMNEELPVEQFSWKRLVVEAYLQCMKSGT